jgi:hypothetical protein
VAARFLENVWTSDLGVCFTGGVRGFTGGVRGFTGGERFYW